MNKRIKKKTMSKDIKEVVYMKIGINKDLDLCPTLKFKSWKKFMKAGKYYCNKYKCDMWVNVPSLQKLDEEIYE